MDNPIRESVLTEFGMYTYKHGTGDYESGWDALSRVEKAAEAMAEEIVRMRFEAIVLGAELIHANIPETT